MSKHYFLGGNTPYGFFSYYNFLIEQKDAKKVYCIKGGPGTGKSSLMKKIAKAMEEKGCTVEYAHCSSDPGSLDGIVIKDKSIAFVDGTSPHVVDPKTPGAVDEILNMGAFWDKDGIYPHKDEIIALNSEISSLFSHAYNYLASVKHIWNDTENLYSKIISDNAPHIQADKVINKHFKNIPVSDKSGSKRKLFSTAFTPEGVKNTVDTLTDGYNVYTLKGFSGKFLNIISDYATARGLYTENYFSPMEPEKDIEHLIIPELNIAFVSSNEFHTIDKGEAIDFSEFYNHDLYDKYLTDIEYNARLIAELISKTSSTIAKAKKLHDDLEKCYIPYMDFEKADKEYERIIAEIN